jgi:hypothetical protein
MKLIQDIGDRPNNREHISKLFFSETTELLESNLAWNAHPVVALLKCHIFFVPIDNLRLLPWQVKVLTDAKMNNSSVFFLRPSYI